MKPKILIVAYAVSPEHGSEPGMAWNYLSFLSTHYNCFLIAEERKWRRYESAIIGLGVRVFWIDKKRNKFLRKLFPPSYYWFYQSWHRKAFELASRLHNVHDFDLFHQLNMVGFREPGYLWKFDKPFVWGPIGGFENTSLRLTPYLTFDQVLFVLGRNIFNLIDRKNLRVKLALNNASAVIVVGSHNYRLAKGIAPNARLLAGREVGLSSNISASFEINKGPLKVLWVGKFINVKNPQLALKIAKQSSSLIQFNFVGVGKLLPRLKNRYKSNNIHFTGGLSRGHVLELMKESDILLVTSLSDLTSTVVIEAIQSGLAIVCLDHMAYSDIIQQNGVKISPGRGLIRRFVESLELLDKDRSLLLTKQNVNRELWRELEWDQNYRVIQEAYEKSINGGSF